MKRAIGLWLPRELGVKAVVAVIVLIHSGCSGGNDPSAVKPKAFEQADFDALKKKAKKPADLRRALQKEIFAPDALPSNANPPASGKKQKSG